MVRALAKNIASSYIGYLKGIAIAMPISGQFGKVIHTPHSIRLLKLLVVLPDCVTKMSFPNLLKQ